MIDKWLSSQEAVWGWDIFSKIKEGENYNHRNTLSISRIIIWACWQIPLIGDAEIGENSHSQTASWASNRTNRHLYSHLFHTNKVQNIISARNRNYLNWNFLNNTDTAAKRHKIHKKNNQHIGISNSYGRQKHEFGLFTSMSILMPM